MWSAAQVKDRIRAVLVAEDDLSKLFNDRISEVEESSDSEGPGSVDVELGRVLAVLQELVECGELEELAGEGEGE